MVCRTKWIRSEQTSWLTCGITRTLSWRMISKCPATLLWRQAWVCKTGSATAGHHRWWESGCFLKCAPSLQSFIPQGWCIEIWYDSNRCFYTHQHWFGFIWEIGSIALKIIYLSSSKSGFFGSTFLKKRSFWFWKQRVHQAHSGYLLYFMVQNIVPLVQKPRKTPWILSMVYIPHYHYIVVVVV